MLQFNNPRSQYSILQRFDFFFPYYARANNIRMVEFHLFTILRDDPSTFCVTVTHLKQFNHKATNARIAHKQARSCKYRVYLIDLALHRSRGGRDARAEIITRQTFTGGIVVVFHQNRRRNGAVSLVPCGLTFRLAVARRVREISKLIFVSPVAGGGE